MNRGSTDNISVIMVGLNDPQLVREAKKGNEHIKILSSMNQTSKKKWIWVIKKIVFPKKCDRLIAK